ncbi:MAG: hypothetical protein O9327_18315 [Polaromonas sp.]|nr:hypothetical protein [Polaromonas sp.]
MTIRTLGQRLSDLLKRRGGDPTDIDLFLRYRGISSAQPETLEALATSGVSHQRIWYRIKRLQTGALAKVTNALNDADLVSYRSHVIEALEAIAEHAPRAVDVLQIELDDAVAMRLQVLSNLESPDPLLQAKLQRIAGMGRVTAAIRIADILGLPMPVQLRTWRSRPKYEDAAQARLATVKSKSNRTVGIVQAIAHTGSPDFSKSLLTDARDICKSAGVVGAIQLADAFAAKRSIPIDHAEALALLEPFAVHLGRSAGDEWFTFVNSPNAFAELAKERISLLGQMSFESLLHAYERRSRGAWRGSAGCSNEILKSALSAHGLVIDGDVMTRGVRGRGQVFPSDPVGKTKANTVLAQMIKVFQRQSERLGAKDLVRAEYMRSLKEAGVNEVTARIYIASSGAFYARGKKVALDNEKAVLL